MTKPSTISQPRPSTQKPKPPMNRPPVNQPPPQVPGPGDRPDGGPGLMPAPD